MGGKSESSDSLFTKANAIKSLGTTVLRNRLSAVARISDWITDIFGTSYKITSNDSISYHCQTFNWQKYRQIWKYLDK